MRKSSEPTSLFEPAARPSAKVLSFPRRTLAPIPGNLTCLVLVKHAETEKALLVSSCGNSSKAVWCPKSMLIIEPGERANFIVATLPKLIAEQRGLSPHAMIDASWFASDQAEALQEAKALAARKRNRLRLARQPLPYPGRNAFA